MKRTPRIIALLVAVVMVAALFAACSGTEPETTTTEATTTEGTSTEATTTEATTTEATTEDTTPPRTTYDGYEFTVAGSDKSFPHYDENGAFLSELDAELYEKLSAVYDELDITMVKIDNTYDNWLEAITQTNLSGDKFADLIYCRQDEFLPSGKAGYIYPVDGEKLIGLGLDCFDATRWYQPTVTELKVFDHYWGLDIASKYSSCRTGYFVTFNHDLVEAAGYPDLYQLVRDYKWNWETYLDIAVKATKDTDGDGTPDYWGTGATAWGCESVANGVNYIGQDETGKYILTMDSPEGIEALQFLYDMNFGTNSRCPESSGVCRQAFADGTIAFNWAAMNHIQSINETCRQSNHPYGIVPMPLGPHGTEYVSAHDDLDMYVIQTTNDNVERVVDIVNSWALIVNDTESFLEVLDDGRCNREEDREMMVQYIIPNFTLMMMEITDDIHYAIDAGFISGVSYREMTPAQVIEEYGGIAQGYIDDFFNK